MCYRKGKEPNLAASQNNTVKWNVTILKRIVYDGDRTATIARAFSGLRSPDGYPPSWKFSYYVGRIHEEIHATLHCKFQTYLSFLQSTIIEEKKKRRLSRQEKRKSNFLLAATPTMTGPGGAFCVNKPTECNINSANKN